LVKEHFRINQIFGTPQGCYINFSSFHISFVNRKGAKAQRMINPFQCANMLLGYFLLVKIFVITTINHSTGSSLLQAGHAELVSASVFSNGSRNKFGMTSFNNI
jgi:hypothetical protein